MAMIEIPDDLWEFLQEHAHRKQRRPEDLLIKVLDDYRQHETTGRAKSLALKGYGVRAEEKEER